jgi:hypothetical protein
MVYRSNYCAVDSEIQTFCEKQSPGVERGLSGFAWIPLNGGPSRLEQGTMRLMAPKRSVLIGAGFQLPRQLRLLRQIDRYPALVPRPRRTRQTGGFLSELGWGSVQLALAREAETGKANAKKR